MGSFLNYYVSRMLDPSEVISESSDGFSAASFARKNRSGSALDAQIRKLSDRHPSAQRCDVEDAILDALKEVSRRKPSTEASAKRLLKKTAESILSGKKREKKGVRKSLSCIGSIKGIASSGKDLESVVRRAGKMLTANERRVLELCSKGHSVRSIGSETGMSFPTAWRVLNSALDKIRISHGMKSRHMDRR